MRRRHTSEAGRGPRRRKWQELRKQPRRGIFLLPSLLPTGHLLWEIPAGLRDVSGEPPQVTAARDLAPRIRSPAEDRLQWKRNGLAIVSVLSVIGAC